jgi:polysaccharide export outer membrane protein
MSRHEFTQSGLPAIRRIVANALTALLIASLPLECSYAGNLTGQLQFAEGTYRINVGDILSVNVYNQPDLSNSGILVRSDGNASFNGVGEVQVAGKTIREATELLESQVRELVREPRVTLTVTESKPPSVYLAGAVMHPGMLQAGTTNSSNNGSTTDADGKFSPGGGSTSSASSSRMDFRISSVLAAAGGVKLSADLANVMITRNGQPYKTINLWDMLKEGNNEADLMLQNGDSVYIPELPEQALDDATYRLLLTSAIGPKTFPVRIIGDVKQPGVYELNGTSPYLNSAIAKGGGFNVSANRKVVALRRFTSEDKFSTLMINPNKHDFMLRPNDVIYVSEQKIYKAGQFSENVSKVFSPFTSTANAFFGLAVLGRSWK